MSSGRQEPYQLRRAALLAWCAAVVTLHPDAIAARVTEQGGVLRGWFENEREGTQAALLGLPWGEVLVFRGTEVRFDDLRETLRDLRTDIQFKPTDYLGARVHRGFLRAWRSIENEVVPAALSAADGRRLFITGHSLGGALAKCAAMAIPSDRIAAVYTFGAPRLGNLAVDGLIGAPLYQFIHAADIVPRVPLLMLGFRSAGDKRYIARNGLIIRSPSAFRTMGRFFWTLLTHPTWLVKDHAISTGYLAPIEASLKP